jgi:hypothetical protein
MSLRGRSLPGTQRRTMFVAVRVCTLLAMTDMDDNYARETQSISN